MSVHMSITASREAKHATRGDYASGALDTAASFVGIEAPLTRKAHPTRHS